MKARLLGLALALGATPALAQRNELALLGGYTTAGDIENKAPTVRTLEIASAFTWGLAVTRFFSSHLGLEASWTRKESGLRLASTSDEVTLFDVDHDLLQASLVWEPGGDGARVRPFLLAGVGAAFLDGRNLPTDTKLAWTAGAGLKWYASSRLGARVQARYAPTYLHDTSSEFCDPFGFCQAWLQQLEFTGGVNVRF